MNTPEVWLPVTESELGELYHISNCGRVMRVKGGSSTKAGYVLNPTCPSKRYPYLNLCKNGKRYLKYVHILVAQAFLGPRPEGYEVNHIDGNKFNNHVDNLEYITHLKNMQHAQEMGLYNPVQGERNMHSKLTEKDVRAIRLRWQSGEKQKHIAINYGVKPSCINAIVRNRTWKHI